MIFLDFLMDFYGFSRVFMVFCGYLWFFCVFFLSFFAGICGCLWILMGFSFISWNLVVDFQGPDDI
jgi:hypothetical protein